PSLAVDKTTTSTPANGETYALGETISYKIVVTNDGNLTITDVVVTDELTGDEWTVESLIPGETAEFTAEYVVTEADILAGKVVNVATANGNNPSDDPTDPGEDPVEDPTDDIKVDMIVTKESDADENTGLGDTITYTITVTNAGNVSFTNVVVDDKLEGAVIVPAEGFTIDENGNAVFAQIAVGETVELTATYVVTEADLAVEEGAEVEAEITNVVTAIGDEIDNPKDEEPETFIPSGEASVTDEIVPYTVTVNYWYYWYDVVDTEVAAPSVVEQHFNGETYQIVSPVIEGYKATIEVVEGVMDGDIVIDVIYYRIRQHLTIYYVYEDGTTAAATYDKRIGVGNKYSVTSPYIPGFTASIQVVSGTMPNRDLVFTVIYVPDVYEVPMNIGNVTMNVGDCFE
ncbi:MAG: DUF11 domain-containing protein, partial [Clostridia bacterium]|nr:DUF11 domain-containing protein [Clostridia bacterium]